MTDRNGTYYAALASDGDGTLMRGKRLAKRTVMALERMEADGRKLILATGERSAQLVHFPRLDLFDLVVAENGGLLFWPATRSTRLLAEPPPAAFVRLLRKRGVDPLAHGKVIVCTEEPHDSTLAEAIGELGLDWQVIYNRRSVMALPSGVDKASGLAAALKELGLPPAGVVAVGDALNDLPMLRLVGCGAAVASADPALKREASVVLRGGAGAGVVELVGRLLAGDLPGAAGGRRRTGS